MIYLKQLGHKDGDHSDGWTKNVVKYDMGIPSVVYVESDADQKKYSITSYNT